MSDELEPQESRPYRPERKRKPRAENPVKRTRQSKPSAGLAEREIDRRLAELISERSTAMVNVSKLVYWQDRVQRLQQEIESLITMRQNLLGIGPPQPVQNWTGIPRVTEPSKVEYSPYRDISGITSAPAKQPHPTTGNMGTEVASEAGFS